MTSAERFEMIKDWTILVERNVPGVQPDEVRRIMALIISDLDYQVEPNFWHRVSEARNRLDECGCSICIDRRWRPHRWDSFVKALRKIELNSNYPLISNPRTVLYDPNQIEKITESLTRHGKVILQDTLDKLKGE